MTVRELVTGARDQLARAGISAREAGLDAELLARDLLGWDRATFLAHDADPAPAGFAEALDARAARRAAREPMAYIRGTQEFYGRSFTVSPAVLIPRWETELLIEEALAWLRAQGGAAEVADIGTGSGCIAVSLAAEVPTARLTATDISADALEVARVNAGRFGVDGRVRFVHGTYLAGLPGPFDLIVANPPYVRAGDASALQPEVRDHEPSVALYGGDDGMRDVRAVLGEAVRALRPGGRLVMELGAGQDDVVMALAAATPGLGDARMCEDLQGIPRVLVATRA